MPEHDDSQSRSERPGASERSERSGGSERFWGSFASAGAGREGPRRAGREAGAGDDPSSPPPRGDADHECLEWCPICRTAEVLRGATPDEVRDQLQHLQRDALVALRSALDAYIERLDDTERRAARRVEDIPID